MFQGLKANGFLDNPDSVLCSSVFAENETNRETAIYQLDAIKALVAKHS
jgi:myo-inositol catabolism protein IolH